MTRRRANVRPTETSPRQIQNALTMLGRGFFENWGEATLADGTTSTEITATSHGADANILLFPQSASAVAANAYVARSDVTSGGFTISHDSSTATDMDIVYMWVQ